MAIKEDYENLTAACHKWGGGKGAYVLALSPDEEQVKILKANISAHRTVVLATTREKWDLANPLPTSFTTPDIIVACNVFHYAHMPELWFKNCFAACRELWIQDLCHRPRNGDDIYSQLGKDGDMLRYWLGQSPTVYGHFNLQMHKDRLLDYWVYDAGSMRTGQTLINFMARFRGDL